MRQDYPTGGAASSGARPDSSPDGVQYGSFADAFVGFELGLGALVSDVGEGVLKHSEEFQEKPGLPANGHGDEVLVRFAASS